MISNEVLDNFRESLNTIVAYDDKQLIHRDDWGVINFEKAEAEIDSILYFAKQLQNLPLENLDDSSANNVLGDFPEIIRLLSEIDSFSLVEQSNPAAQRDSICSQINQYEQLLHSKVGPLLPYLAYRSDDFATRNIELKEELNNLKEESKDFKKWCEEQKSEINKILSATREAAASTGVAMFTDEFAKKASDLVTRASKWLLASIAFAVTTIATSIILYFYPALPENAEIWQAVRLMFSKVAAIAILITGTLWCGRIYRALIHQATVNEHRALSLKTFQAFVHSTDDQYVKDAVLMAATNAVFANTPTGFVEQSVDKDGGVSFVEFGRSQSGGRASGITDVGKQSNIV